MKKANTTTIYVPKLHYDNRITIEAQGHLFKLKVSHRPSFNPYGGYRGNICEFSHQSRKRMLELLARIDTVQAGFIAFVTLTYPGRNGPPSPEDTERDRQTFLKRIKRQFPQASAIWRREWEERKSGEFRGKEFPHYHILFFGLPFFPHEELNSMWAEVLDYWQYVRTEIKGIECWRQAFYYVAKYMAKPVENDSDKRQPAGSVPAARKAGTSAGGEAACSLVYGTYLTEGSEEKREKPRSIGRSWGKFNSKHLPLAKRYQAKLPPGEWLNLAKEMASQEWEGVNDLEDYGFTLFEQNMNMSEQWFRNCHDMAGVLQPKPDDGIPI